MNASHTEPRPRHPTLYRLAADGRSLEFLYARCPGCRRLTFPANAPGCMHCGAPLDEAEPVVLPGEGTLMEYVTLHVALAPGMPVPAIAGDIRIADGIVEQAVIGVADESGLRPGMALTAIAAFEEDGLTYRCAFVPAGEDPQ
ncbi:zinc ribbon domain-containing protein [Cupriavidus gilardii]|uniref:Zn-ribbon domain-containing OB-fold protein n=1 Tax=Cupriavidus gilardii TaxID=82541 RepID=UPI0021BF8CA4|nr:zinc ribbon domain-containing protein [Cupriavidus gilardii]MCT9118494.1 zinc ribbon domain-containing protein [Cupriavidus gilardii]